VHSQKSVAAALREPRGGAVEDAVVQANCSEIELNIGRVAEKRELSLHAREYWWKISWPYKEGRKLIRKFANAPASMLKGNDLISKSG